MKKIRALRADEIEVRVARCNEYGAFLLLYKDARCDKRILDETFGAENWQDRYLEIHGNLFCEIGVKYADEWVWKADCGVERGAGDDQIDKKGEASDAFKRAAFNVGIGRELYTRINIFVKVKTSKNTKGKYEIEDRYLTFYVSEIETDNEREKITHLMINAVDKKGLDAVCFHWDEKKRATPTDAQKPEATPPQKKGLSKKNLIVLQKMTEQTAKSLGAAVTDVLQNVYDTFGFSGASDINDDNIEQVLDLLRKWAGVPEGVA